jgi:AbrB family looped-hinge helix DNA binding protein
MLLTTLSSKGQIILPSKLRKKLNIKKGSKFIIEFKDNKIILTLLNKEFYERLAGSISEKGKLLKTLISEKEREKNF